MLIETPATLRRFVTPRHTAWNKYVIELVKIQVGLTFQFVDEMLKCDPIQVKQMNLT